MYISNLDKMFRIAYHLCHEHPKSGIPLYYEDAKIIIEADWLSQIKVFEKRFLRYPKLVMSGQYFFNKFYREDYILNFIDDRDFSECWENHMWGLYNEHADDLIYEEDKPVGAPEVNQKETKRVGHKWRKFQKGVW